MIQNRLLQTFLADEKVKKLYLSYKQDPSKQKKDIIESLFQVHVRKVQLLTYFSKILHFESQRFDMKVRKLHQTNPLILDKGINDEEGSIVHLIGEETPAYELSFVSDTHPYNFTNIFEDEALYRTISKLSERQKEVLYLLYVEELTEIEVAQKLGITKQAVNKTKNQSLKKIKQDYEEGESKCQIHH